MKRRDYPGGTYNPPPVAAPPGGWTKFAPEPPKRKPTGPTGAPVPAVPSPISRGAIPGTRNIRRSRRK